MAASKLLTLLLTALMALVPGSGPMAADEPPVRADVAVQATVGALGTDATVAVETTLPSDLPRGAPDAPRDLAVAWQDGMATLSWNAPPAPAPGGAPVHGYRILRAERDGEAHGILVSPTTGARDVAADPRRSYTYAVTAMSADGESAPSSPARLVAALAPLPPEDLEATAADGRARLAWTHPDAGSVVAFVVRVRAGGAVHELARTRDLAYEDALAPGERKEYFVTAANDAGESGAAGPVAARHPLPLGAPRDLVATARAGAIDLSWSPPEATGEGTLRYRVYQQAGANWSEVGRANDTRFTHAVAREGATHRYHVRADDGATLSAPSNEASATTPFTPFPLNATGGHRRILLQWPDIAGAARYDVVRDGSVVAQTRASEHADEGLGDAERHTYVVVARVNGSERRSVEASATTWGVPGAPRDLTATGRVGGIDLRWSAPESDGGSPITAYRIYRANATDGNRTLVGTVGGDATSHADDVPRGRTYTYTVTAVARVEGPASNAATATPLGVPGAPTGLEASREVRAIQLSWAAPADDGGSPIHSYRIYAAREDNRTVLLATVGGDARSWRHEGLGDGENRTYTVAAVSDAGEGARSLPVVGRTQSAPGAPRDVDAQVNLPSAAVRVSWSPPEDDGGARITAYRIYRAYGGTSFLLAQVDGRSFSYWDETCGANVCVYVVAAVNARGEGARSWEASSV